MKKELRAGLLEELKNVSKDKYLDSELVEDALKEALISAARKFLKSSKHMEVEFDEDTSEVKVFLKVEVVDDYPDVPDDWDMEQVTLHDEKYMLLDEALDYNEEAQIGDLLEMEVPVSQFGRQAIQTAKQFLIQKVREAERTKIFETYKDRIGTLINGKVQQIDRGNAIINLGSTDAILPAREKIRSERIRQGDSIKAYIADVAESGKGPQVLLSRVHDQFLGELFKLEVPEIYDGTVEVKGIARDPGQRAKIAVYSSDERVDPVGACVGMKGTRVQSIVRELNNERIDIVEWVDDLTSLIKRSISPANIVRLVEVPGTTRIVVVVEEEDLAQAIGRNGQNIRLASKLVQRSLDVYGEEEYKSLSEAEKERILNPREDDTMVEIEQPSNKLEDLFKSDEELEAEVETDDQVEESMDSDDSQESLDD